MDISLLKSLYELWKPVFPHLSLYIKEVYGRGGGDIIEVGPFCGTIFSLKASGTGETHTLATFPKGMGRFFKDEIETFGFDGRIRILECDDAFSCFKEHKFDLIIYRGALFFPDFFKVDYNGIFRMLKKGGVALVGGGFGKYTPDEILKEIGRASKELNIAVGKKEVDHKELLKRVIPEGLHKHIEISNEGGLWTILRR
ncbi:MAG: hypothetical protein N2745_09840 [Syntrophorhabdaceae bacterium]|nr:hypothetical protein [Syntrophorhabdaceae bacterium]